MAITTIQNPDTYAPVYNPMWFVVSSNLTSQPNFEYICDVYITGVTFAGGSTYLRLKCPADPTYGRGVFNIAPILERELTSDIGNTIYGFQQCTNSILQYTVQFGELYGLSSGVTAYPNLNSANGLAFIGGLQAIEFKDYTVNNYVVAGIGTNRTVNLLSNAPSSGTIRTSENQWIYMMSQTSGAIKYANILIYDANGLINAVRIINHQYHNTSTIANNMLRFPAGYNVDSISESDRVYRTSSNVDYPLLLGDSSVTKMEIYFTDTNYNKITASYWTFKSTPCTDHTVYRLHFKNKYGGFDSFSFIRASQKSSDIKRNKFEKVMGNFKSASSYTYNKTDRFETNIYTEYKHTIKLNSDWINQNQSVWLEELLTSPEIYHDDATHGLLPVNITDTKYIQRQHKTDKLFNLSIDIQYTFNERRQGA